MPICYVALGGNLGPAAETFRQALARLDAESGVDVRRISGLYRTSPVGDDAGSEFLNCAAELETTQPPVTLLDTLQAVENASGRTREIRWGPRTLDLDIIFYDDCIVELPRLHVPHPACWYRRFVLDPLNEIAAEAWHPKRRLTVRQLRSRLLTRPFRVTLTGGEPSARQRLLGTLRASFAAVDFLDELTDAAVAMHESSLLVWLGPSADEPSRPPHPDIESHPGWLDATSDIGDVATFLIHVLSSALGHVSRVADMEPLQGSFR